MRPPRPIPARSPDIDDPELAAAKAAARRTARVRRAVLARSAPPGAGERLADRLGAGLGLPAGAPVAGYWPTATEIDPRPFLRRVVAAGHPCCLPVVAVADGPLAFREWRPGDALVPGALRIPTPPESAATVAPRIILVPLLAADRSGARLGYGGGFYDRTLNALRAADSVMAIGLAYPGQIVARVPCGPADARLDAIATERAIIPIGDAT